MQGVFDASSLPVTSSKKDFPWRDTRVAIIRITQTGVVEHAGVISEKQALARDCRPDDCLLAVRLLSYPQPKPEVLLVDDIEQARSALA